MFDSDDLEEKVMKEENPKSSSDQFPIKKLTFPNFQGKKKEQEEYSKKKMDDVLKNLEEYNKSEEEKRLKLEQETFEKSNKYFILLY